MIITIHEGRNREVRRMCESIGHPVVRLRRVAIGPLRDPRLKPGKWRELTPQEVKRLQDATQRKVVRDLKPGARSLKSHQR
jgi:23S rRNA pseudouridine2605 synthase